MRYRRLLPMAALLGPTLVACQLLVGINDEGVARPDAALASPDAGLDVAFDDPCKKLHPPPRPNDSELPTQPDRPRLAFGIRTVRLRPNGMVIGYDLDDRCTGDTTSTTSGAPCRSLKLPGGPADDPFGVDNAFAKEVVANIFFKEGVDDPLAVRLTSQISDGQRTVLVVLSDYNGEKNDGEVHLGLVPSEGLQSVGCDGGVPADAGADAGALVPKWDGCDQWSYVPGTVVGGVAPSQVSAGYVKDNVLVIDWRALDLDLAFGEVHFPLHEALLTATIASERTANGITFALQEGIVTGRVGSADLINAAGRFYRSVVCGQPGIAVLLSQYACNARDLPLLRSDDGRDTTCNAVSFSLGFEASPARLGTEGVPPQSGECAGLDTRCPEERDATAD